MKNLLATTALSLILFVPKMSASTEITLGGVSLQLDTTYHAKIGPGTTRTQLHLSGSQPLDVHYITVDLSAPGVKMRAARANTANGLQKPSEMGKLLSTGSTMAIAGVNGDFYDVTSTYPDGTTRPRMTTYTTIVDNEILKTSPQAYQFVVDDNGLPFISCLDFSGSTISDATQSVTFAGVNIESINSSGDTAPDNAVTLYNSKGWKSPYQTQFEGECAEVTATPVNITDAAGSISGTYKITSSVTSTGNLEIPSGECVLLGRGDGKLFIESLSIGDLVTIDCHATLSDGTPVNPVLAIGGNPPTVSGGIAQESDGSRSDAVDLHPRTGVGISADGNTVVMMVVDGRGASYGVTTRQLGDLLVYAGVSEALNFDGGGSSTCWTQPFGVINTCSDSSGERTVADALFVTAEGEVNDNTVAEIRFEDWRHEIIQYSTWTPKILAYNAAGILIDTDLKGCSLSCPGSLGEISEDGVLMASGDQDGILTAEYNGIYTSVMVSVKKMDAHSLIEDVSAWTVNGSSVKNQTLGKNGDGMTVDYTMGASTGSASVTVVGRKEMPEDTEILKIKVNPATAAIKKLIVNLKAANSSSNTKIQYTDIPQNKEYLIEIYLKDYFDLGDESTVPVTFVSMVITPGEGAKEDGHIEFTEISAITPAEASSGVNEIKISEEITSQDSGIEYYDMTGVRVTNPGKGVYIRRQGSKVSKIIIK